MLDRIEIDLVGVQESSQKTKNILISARKDLNLMRYEYTRDIRIAPGEIPHSHPILTLNNRLIKRNEIVCTYIHEQMHWYVTWFSHASTSSWRALIDDIESRYPDIPITFPEGANTRFSSLLHVIVNWLEIEAAIDVLGEAEALEVVTKNFVYSGIYKIVLRDRVELSKLFKDAGIVPIRYAPDMTADDLKLAARMDEAKID